MRDSGPSTPRLVGSIQVRPPGSDARSREAEMLGIPEDGLRFGTRRDDRDRYEDDDLR